MGARKKVFDILVVASPQTSDKMPLDLRNVTEISFPGKYHRTVATLVRCQSLNPTFFQNSPAQANFYVDKSSVINSIAKQHPANSKQNELTVYKVFSQSPLATSIQNGRWSLLFQCGGMGRKCYGNVCHC